MKLKKSLSIFFDWVFKGISLIGFIFLCVGIGVRGKNRDNTDTDLYFIIIGLIMLLPLFIYILKDQMFSSVANRQNRDKSVPKLGQVPYIKRSQ
jgi:uncharacterized membrane protein